MANFEDRNLNNKIKIKKVLFISCILLDLGMVACAQDLPEKPSIVYIMADDLGYGDLGCYGQAEFATPRIDQMAVEGMRFTQHYAGATVCAPSRCSLMTGVHTGHTVVRGNREVQPIGQAPMPGETLTVAKLLKQAGYATGAFGKWGLGYPGSASDPLHMGFDTFFGYNCQRNAHNYYPTWLFDNDKKISLDGKTYSHDLIIDRGLEFIRAHQDQPFFCYIPVAIPHASLHVPEPYAAPFRKKFHQFEEMIVDYPYQGGREVDNPAASFAGMMTKLDEDVGRVLDLLAELGLDKKTLVIFTSDNGPHMEGGHQPDFFNSNGPLCGYKRNLTEGGIRVPMIARLPGVVPAGSTSAHQSAFWDFLPTVCQLAGIATPAGLDGISYLPTLRGDAVKQKVHDYLYWEFPARGGKRALLQGDWKIIQRKVATAKPDMPMLFNLRNDLGEQHDLASEHPERVQRMLALMDSAHRPNQTFPLFFQEHKNAPE